MEILSLVAQITIVGIAKIKQNTSHPREAWQQWTCHQVLEGEYMKEVTREQVIRIARNKRTPMAVVHGGGLGYPFMTTNLRNVQSNPSAPLPQRFRITMVLQ
jgi:hypothetical protein